MSLNAIEHLSIYHSYVKVAKKKNQEVTRPFRSDSLFISFVERATVLP